MRPSKQMANMHDKAEQLVFGTDRQLTLDETQFCYDHWLPLVNHRVDVSGAFFTPQGIARNLAILHRGCGSLIDICAGIGGLTFQQLRMGGVQLRWPHLGEYKRVVAVELSGQYAAVGQRLLPQVEWVVADALDRSTWYRPLNMFEEAGAALLGDGGRFGFAISNPPFGRVQTVDKNAGAWLDYKGPADLTFALLCGVVADDAVVILPKNSVPEELQEERGLPDKYKHGDPAHVERWARAVEQMGVYTESGGMYWVNDMGDEEDYQWRGAKPCIDIITLGRED